MQYNFEETLAYIFLFCNQHARLHNTHTEHGNVHVSKKMLIQEWAYCCKGNWNLYDCSLQKYQVFQLKGSPTGIYCSNSTIETSEEWVKFVQN